MSQLVETTQVSFTNTADSEAAFGLDITPAGQGVQRITLRASADAYVDFDKVADATQSFELLAADTGPTTFDFEGGSVKKVHVKGKTGSGTLYIVGIRI